MKAVCTRNRTHNRFKTMVAEVHAWVVDAHGKFVRDNGCIDIAHAPDRQNVWLCNICGKPVKWVDDKVAG